MIEAAFDLRLDHGRCVVVRLPDDASLEAWAEGRILAEERAYASTLRAARRRSWLAGRIALREVIARECLTVPAILPDERGAPSLPHEMTGSITHKTEVAAALLLRRSGCRVGVDVEEDVPGSIDISRKVLTPDELVELSRLPERSRPSEVLLRFSTKEAIYKALDPYVRRYVGFKEVSVSPRPDGSTQVRLNLDEKEGPFVVGARWQRMGGLILTTACVSPPA